MNEQEIMMNEKIKKREKLDTILAYILLVIIISAIVFVLYLKFIRREKSTVKPEEHLNNYITLNEISSKLNTSTLANKYKNDNATFTSNVNGNSLNIDYKKDNEIINLNVKTIGTELEFNITEDNKVIAEEIYKEIANIICVYYKNTEDSCRSTLSKINENNSVDGIRYVSSDNNKFVYINTAKSIDVESIDLYTEVTNVELSKTNYELKLDTEVINNIKVEKTDTNLAFTGNITTTSENKNISVLVTLYDENSAKLAEEKYEYNDTNQISDNSEFKVEFNLNDNLKLENIKYYSINIQK